MREILFSAKRINDGDWVCGYPVKHGEQWYIYTGETDRLHKHTDRYGVELTHEIRYEVEPETICQCSFLNDSRGNKIFDGDIVKYPYDVPNIDEKTIQTGIVRFGKKYKETQVTTEMDYGFYIEWVGGMNGILRKDIGYWHDMIAVCGNIFDNPELLEVTK